MLVHEALELIGRGKLKFGDPVDVEATQLFWLFAAAREKIERRYQEGPARDKHLANLLQADVGALERFLHPRQWLKKKRETTEALLVTT